MLGARTKQVFSYGRRNRRIVNDSRDPFDDVEDAKQSGSHHIREPMGKGHALTSTFSPHVSSSNRPLKRRADSKAEPPMKRRSVSGSGRQPLTPHSVNVSRKSALGGPSKKPSLSGSHGASRALLPQSPVISVDILVLDENGRRLSLEKRSKSTVRANHKKTLLGESPAYRQAAATSVILVSDSDDDDSDSAPSRQLARRAKRWPKVTVSSDEEDVAEPPIHRTSSPTSADPNPSPKSTSAASDILKCPIPRHSKPTSPPKPQFWVEIVSPRPPALSQSRPQALPPYHYLPEPSRVKHRQLTPIRRKGSTFSQILPSPSTPTDGDISFDLDGLTISSISYESPAPMNQPAHLLSLLDECGQSAPAEFSAFIEAFPVHSVVQSTCSGPVAFRKIGEASYSEVFGIGDVVLKIIPIRDEECLVRDDVDTPAPSDAKDILKEIVVTRALGEMCNGFVSLLKTYVVRGKYPSLLLDLWDDYNQTKGSESVRPDMLAVSQVYAIIVLPNGGPDLEAYTFSQPTKIGWRQACSLFWQVVRALATAENLVSFEHRDLHWGQILVKDVPSKVFDRGVRLPMDHPAYGVQATVIDLGLARMDACADYGSTEICWTPFDEEIFEGEGDYQFDIYRLMRKHNGGRWADFRPLTNVMWLHYLLIKLLKSKNLRPPRKSAAATLSPGFTERQCYESLLKMEGLLAQSVREVRTHRQVTKKGRRKVVSPTKDITVSTSGPQCAGDVLKFGETMGWV
ncbi:hypothetical protein EDB85DRAFT_2070131 [Lactarius pseudohatsudake]|nr:hypothetical protein EDB85DRAFT_2070131 [Lactarius pseudohatsudake]